jgi:hypothetical protein
VDIYSYEVNIDIEEDQKDSLDTVLFTRDGDIYFPFANDDPELDKENQPMTNTCDNDTELAKEQHQMQDEYHATYGTRHLPPNYPCAVIQSIVNNWGVAKRTINNLPVLTIDTNAAYIIDVRSGSAFPWLSGNGNGATTTKRYLRSAHPGLGYNLLHTLKDATILVDSYSYELGVELIYTYYHLVGANGDRIQEAHDADARNMTHYEQYEFKYASMNLEDRPKRWQRRRQRVNARRTKQRPTSRRATGRSRGGYYK